MLIKANFPILVHFTFSSRNAVSYNILLNLKANLRYKSDVTFALHNWDNFPKHQAVASENRAWQHFMTGIYFPWSNQLKWRVWNLFVHWSRQIISKGWEKGWDCQAWALDYPFREAFKSKISNPPKTFSSRTLQELWVGLTCFLHRDRLSSVFYLVLFKNIFSFAYF